MEGRADTVHSVINTGKRWGASANAPSVASPRRLPRRDPGSLVESGGERPPDLRINADPPFLFGRPTTQTTFSFDLAAGLDVERLREIPQC